MDCVFCKIVRGEVPSDRIYEDDDVLVFRDIHPSAPVHYLAVSRTHIESVVRLDAGHRAIVAALVFAAKGVAEQLGLRGYKLVFNVGREGGQMVDHLHLHLLGGWRGSEGEALPHPRLDK